MSNTQPGKDKGLFSAHLLQPTRSIVSRGQQVSDRSPANSCPCSRLQRISQKLFPAQYSSLGTTTGKEINFQKADKKSLPEMEKAKGINTANPNKCKHWGGEM